jgi:hypothetical protein
MRSFTTVLAATLFAAAPAAAQKQGQPNLILTIYAGVGSGHLLWEVERQPLLVGGSTLNPPDTVNLVRHLSSTLMIGGVFQLFPSGALGFSVDVGYRSLSLDDTCSPVAPFTDTTFNRTLCENITAQTLYGGSVITLGVSGIARVAPGGVVSPYLRLGANAAFTTASTIELAAPEQPGGLPRVVIRDDSPRRNSASLLAAGGIMLRVGQGYQIRLEFRDDMTVFERVTGPANFVAIAPTKTEFFHNLGLVIGFDVLLEQRRTRRY